MSTPRRRHAIVQAGRLLQQGLLAPLLLTARPQAPGAGGLRTLPRRHWKVPIGRQKLWALQLLVAYEPTASISMTSGA
jgi:hypothetical protein